MLTLINTNRMTPPIAPIGLDYIAGAVREAGHDVELLDLCLAEDPSAEIAQHFSRCQPDLVGLSFRNVDDCFWPSAQSFLPTLKQDVAAVRQHTDAPIVLGGVGYSMFSQRIVEHTGADFGVWGDGEPSLVALLNELRGARRLNRVPGLAYRRDGAMHANSPSWPQTVAFSSSRDLVDNAAYFRRGGQIGVETKRGCSRRCTYCADPLAKGTTHRLRDPAEVAAEIESLLELDIDVYHMCDPEFNLPANHAIDVCDELVRRGLGSRVRWYAYLTVLPFSEELARRMRRAGCVGINFTSDAANPAMLKTYGQPHLEGDMARAVERCRNNGIAVMLDMLLGGPGETPESVAETIEAFKRIAPDCAGAALGVRVYPNTAMASLVATEGPLEANRSIRRHYGGAIDLLQPTFYISSALGDHPGRLVCDLIGGDERFFPPAEEISYSPNGGTSDHNYNDNQPLVDAIAAGSRGAYWDILRRLRSA